MKPGSLRIVAINSEGTERQVWKYQPNSDGHDEFYNRVEWLDAHDWKSWLYEMTDKGWTEF